MPQLAKKTLDGNVETIILATLLEGPNYGYALVKDINEKHAGLLALGEGTIYPVLYRMEEKGLLLAETRQTPAGRERKYYRIAPAGRKALAENMQQWAALTQVMETIRKSLPPQTKPVPKTA
jgi:DNA-binding PadR family transcriptional regulator